MGAEKELVKLGLTDGESKVYTALLEIGSGTVGPVVKKSGVAYSNIYEILDRLTKKGLVSFVLKEGTKYFQPVSPESLYDYVEKKEKELEEQKTFLDKFVPTLKALQIKKPDQEAEIFIGLKGIKAAYTKMVSEYKGGEWLFFYVHKEQYGDMTDRFYFSIKYLLKKIKTTRGIGNKLTEEAKFTKSAKKFVDYRFVNFPIPGNIDMVGDMVFVQSWSEKPVGFLIKSEQVASFMREYFESVWKVAKR